MAGEAQKTRRLEAIILAAGKGTRMGSDLPKVLHPVADRPMVHWVIDACEQAGAIRQVIVVGHEADRVREALAEREQCLFVEQRQQLGTGHAVMMAGEVYARDGEQVDVLVLYGDGPLIRAQTLRRLVAAHRGSGAAATLATAMLDDPRGYGRIIRDANGRFAGIVEQKDADERQQAIREVNPGIYCFRADALFEALGRIGNTNAKGEYYLTDVPGLLASEGRKVELVEAMAAEDVLSINTPQQLAEVDGLMRQRLGMEVGR